MLNDLENAYKAVNKKFEIYGHFLESDDEEDNKSITEYENKFETMYDDLCKARKLLQKTVSSLVPLYVPPGP